MAVVIGELHHGKYEVIWFVERVENLISRYGDGVRPNHSSLDLDKSQPASARDPALNVIA